MRNSIFHQDNSLLFWRIFPKFLYPNVLLSYFGDWILIFLYLKGGMKIKIKTQGKPNQTKKQQQWQNKRVVLKGRRKYSEDSPVWFQVSFVELKWRFLLLHKQHYTFICPPFSVSLICSSFHRVQGLIVCSSLYHHCQQW